MNIKEFQIKEAENKMATARAMNAWRNRQRPEPADQDAFCIRLICLIIIGLILGVAGASVYWEFRYNIVDFLCEHGQLHELSCKFYQLERIANGRPIVLQPVPCALVNKTGDNCTELVIWDGDYGQQGLWNLTHYNYTIPTATRFPAKEKQDKG